MPQVNLQEYFAKAASVLEAAGFELHEDDRDGETMTRMGFSKRVADPKALFQGAGGFVEFNLPGNLDGTLVTVAHMLGTGNSQPSSDSPSN